MSECPHAVTSSAYLGALEVEPFGGGRRRVGERLGVTGNTPLSVVQLGCHCPAPVLEARLATVLPLLRW
jgi:hypothetical protein